MKRNITLLSFLSLATFANAQTNPAITAWLRNTTGTTARHYVKGNYTPITSTDSVNVQTVQYSTNYVYIRTKGLPAYVTGPFLDGNPSIATSQNAIFKFPLTPVKNTGTATSTTGGNIGIFINGVALFDYRDGYSWKSSTSTLTQRGGDGVWNRDAIVGETIGFDCAKGHPAMGNYHHHQNPSAFKLDLKTLSTVCSLYDADGLYVLDSTKHSPLIGFTYDGFPIYGAYGYKNVDGTGGIVRIKSSYAKRNITKRTTYSDGTSVTAGPDVSTTYPVGYFREDYQYNATSAATPDYLDEHNGRFCVTPEYPAGVYCYFATVDANWNSAYPYVVGPSFYGVVQASKVTAITETVTTYTGGSLPVNLFSFNGYADNNTNILKWSTASEIGNSHFDIERSIDGVNFSKIGQVQAVGAIGTTNNYAFTDYVPVNGTDYYRLMQWDLNGSYSYSNTITVAKANAAFNVRVFPNPASDYLLVQADDILRKDVQVVISDMSGKIVLTKSLPQGSTLCYIETATIYAGNYVLTVLDNSGYKKSFKVAIVK
ncbi:YHYH protein [Parasediminibacterium sp. JCM 36343]|uniref:YHYH protein n=1 Tax=Parasediminibacterium sp. JCM 36343 TaxID=3374279 RepID=UPI00397992FD